MANYDELVESEQENEQNPEQRDQDRDAEKPSDDSESEYDPDDSSSYTDSSDEESLTYTRLGDEPPASENTPEINMKRFTRILDSKSMKEKRDEEDRNYVHYEDRFDFPYDPENWKEQDLQELWADAPLKMTKPGWDPVWADEEDWEVVKEEIKAGRDPPIAPFYVPYRKYFPAIPDNHHDISNPKAAIEELDRIEEFLKWVSYVFVDGSSYVFLSALFFSSWESRWFLRMYNNVCFCGLCSFSW